MDCLQANGLRDSELFVMSNETLIASLLSKREYKTNYLMMLRFGTMSKPSTANRGMELWIASLRDSRASRSLSPENEKAKRTTETYGLQPFALLMRSGRNGACWKTSADCSVPDMSRSSLKIFPKAGMMRAHSNF